MTSRKRLCAHFVDGKTMWGSWIQREKAVICCWQQEQVEEGPLICPAAALGRLIGWCRYSREAWERKCKTNSHPSGRTYLYRPTSCAPQNRGAGLMQPGSVCASFVKQEGWGQGSSTQAVTCHVDGTKSGLFAVNVSLFICLSQFAKMI